MADTVLIPDRGPSGSRGVTSRQVSRGAGLHKNLVVSKIFDLSGSAATDVLLICRCDVRIQACYVMYVTEATSADAGVLLKLGTVATADAYLSFTSATGQSQNTITDKTSSLPSTLAGKKLAAGSALVASCAGGKVGIGEAILVVEYTIDDDE